MSTLLTILVVIIIFSALVLIHEAGHFFAARRSGIKVLEFGIGFPPRIFGKKKGDTIYSINAIPFGGFVKLYGEDSSDPRVLKDTESYAHKSPWVRTKVVVAGVFMNFLLAIALLTIGFSFGIEPLIVGEEVASYIQQGVVKTQPGFYIHQVPETQASLGITPGDKLLAIDEKPVRTVADVEVFQKGKAKKDLDLTIVTAAGEEKKIHLPLIGEAKDFGLRMKPLIELPRLRVLEIKPNSPVQRAGIRTGDTILRVNGREIFAAEEFYAALQDGPQSAEVEFLHEGTLSKATFPFADAKRVIITKVLPDSPAQKAGVQEGDAISMIDGQAITSPTQVPELIKKRAQEIHKLSVVRNGATQELQVHGADKNEQIGITISSLYSFENAQMSFYQSGLLTSIMKIEHVRYSPLVAFKKSIEESIRLMNLTARGFIGAVASIIGTFNVPSDIGGPVQIAYYTHSFIQEGFFALLRFTALLSISLAVINVLPIPALDGGRLLFIAIEVIFKRRVNARVESLIHGIGFILLLSLIGVITYSDIARLF